MKRFIARSMIATVTLMFIFILGACSDDSDDNGESNDTFDEKTEVTVRERDDPDFLDPHLMEASITERMLLNVFEGLLAPETDGTLKPGIAEDHELTEDGLTYTFDIREDVMFHNGDPVTVDDIIYSFERLTGVNTDEPLSTDFDGIESIEAPDENTIEITLSEANSTFLSYLTGKDSAIIPESNDENHNDEPIGTGPFKFAGYSPGADLILEKNEDYWVEGIPYLEKVTFAFQEDDEAAFLGLEAGDIDLLEIPPHRISEVEDAFKLEYQENNSVVMVGMNQNVAPFDDIKVRQAINYAISKDDVIEAAFSGYATKIGSNMSPAMGPVYKEGLEDVYDQDIKKAKELLAEAGYEDGFKSTISISSHTQRYPDIAQVAVENLKEIGIDLEIEVVEWAVWLERIYAGREYEMTAIDFTGKLSAYDILDRYISDKDNNFMNYENEEYDELMAKVLKEDDEDKQIEMYHRAQEILNEDAAAAYIADYEFVWAMNPELEGTQYYPIFFQDMSEVKFAD